MALKTYKPYTPTLRQKSSLDYSEITTNKPEKSLTVGLSKKAGRDTFGRISVRRRGGGHKRAYRIIDFKRDKVGVPGVVRTIEYDPNRLPTSPWFYVDGEKRYACSERNQGGNDDPQRTDAPITIGNALPLKAIPRARGA